MSLFRFSLLSSSRSKKRDPSPSPDMNPRPSKTPRLSPSAANSQTKSTRLRRTDSHVSLSALCAPPAISPPPPVPLPPVTTTTSVPMPQPSASFSNTPASSSTSSSSSSSIPYTRTLWYYKEQRQKSKALFHSGAPEQDPLFLYFASALLSHQSKEQQQQQQPQQVQPSVLSLTPIGSSSRGIRITQNTHLKAPQQQFPAKPKKIKQRKVIPRFRPSFVPVSSPLAPRPYTSSSLHNMQPTFADDSRPMIPRARRAPDLYRFAIKACMRRSQQGQQLLSLGPRLACKLGDATKELENIVALENGLPPQTSTQKPPSRPLRPLVRTESYADLSMFIQPPNPVPAAAAPAQFQAHDVRMANVDAKNDRSLDLHLEDKDLDFEMFDLTS